MKTLIVDNYDSFTFNLFQMVAAINGEPPIVVCNDKLTWKEFQELQIDNVIISPGPGRPENERDFGICSRIVLESHVPVLGVCLGLQGMGYLFGGKVTRAPEPVHGRTSAISHTGTGIFEGLPQGFQAVRYHSLMVSSPVPECLRLTAWTEDGLVMGLEHRERAIWAVQFHPESICTEHGDELLRNFKRLTARAASATRGLPAAKAAKTTAPGSDWHVFTRKLDTYPDAEQIFRSLFADHSPAFWLDGAGDSTQARFSYMGSARDADATWVSYSTSDEPHNTSVFDYLQTELKRRRVPSPNLPFDFNGGFVGYLGYEMKAECGGQAAHPSPYPDACFILADRLLVFDHQERVVYLVYAGTRDKFAARQWFDETARKLAHKKEVQPAAPADESIHFELEQNREEYLRSIDECMRFIRDGDSYEICLTNRMTARTRVNPLDYYCALRRHNAAPHSAFLQFPDVSIACSSPERFLKIDAHGMVESRLIKGTLRRSTNPSEDRQLRERLRTSTKTRSENLMIVDLLRHDLGRTCEVGSVHVPQMMQVETYTNLHQLVSTVRGRLRAEASAVDCVRAALPGGSMTGAPKIRTMEIIDSLERSARGVYSGTIGFFALNGSADLNIVIRTAVFSKDRVSIGVGGAIVALSDPSAEFDETMLKGQALVEAFRSVVSGDVTIEGIPNETRRAPQTTG